MKPAQENVCRSREQTVVSLTRCDGSGDRPFVSFSSDSSPRWRPRGAPKVTSCRRPGAACFRCELDSLRLHSSGDSHDLIPARTRQAVPPSDEFPEGRAVPRPFRQPLGAVFHKSLLKNDLRQSGYGCNSRDLDLCEPCLGLVGFNECEGGQGPPVRSGRIEVAQCSLAPACLIRIPAINQD
jgi:hypothetical protein